MKNIKIILVLLILISVYTTSKSQKILTTNLGHTNQVECVAFSPNGKYIVSGSMEQSIKLWNVQTGQEIKTFNGHTWRVTSVTFSPDGKYIISASGDKTIKIWDIQTGKELKTLVGHTGFIWSMSISPDGKYIISGSGDKTIKLWNVVTGKEIRTFKGHTNIIESLSFSPDGKYIISGSRDKTIKLWDTQTGQEIKTFRGHTNWVNSVAFNPNGKYIVSGSKDNTIKLWSIQTGKEIKSFTGHKKEVGNVIFSPNGRYIASTGDYDDNIIKLWDAQTGRERKKFERKKYSDGVTKIAFSKDSKYIVAGNRDNEIELWDVNTGIKIRTFKGYIKSINSIAISPNSKYIVSNHLAKWNFHTGKKTLISKYYKDKASVVTFSLDSRNLITGCKYYAKLWDIETDKEIITFEQKRGVQSIAYSPNGKYTVLSGGYIDKSIKLWNNQTGELIRKEKKHTDNVTCLVFSPDNKYYISGSWDKTVKLRNIETGYVIKTFTGHTHQIGCVAISPNNNYIVSGDNGKNIILWDVKTGKEIKHFNGHTSGIESVIFSSDGKSIFSGSGDNTIKQWDIETGKNIKTFKGHSMSVNSVVCNTNGKYLFSGSGDGTIKLWDIQTGNLLITLVDIPNSDDYIVYSPDGRFEGTEEGMKLLYYVEGIDIIPLSSLYEQYYTPNLLARVMQGEDFKEPEIKIDDIKLPPLVEITYPEDKAKVNKEELTVTVKLTDQGGGIDEIRLYLNDKLVNTTQRGFVKVEQNNNEKTKTFTISLMNGENKIKATAFSNQRTESIADEITVFYEGVKKTANLHMIVIGIDNYKNPKYKLNYAVADATAFKDEIEYGSKDIFGSVNITYIKDTDATRTKILQAFETVKSEAKQEDVFIFYYAGHGVMSEDDKPEFHIIPYEVTKLYGSKETMKNTAISANQLQTFSTELKAQKQMFIFDACQSGGMTELLAARGAAEEKAIAQLARSTGTYWLTASNSEQFATEFAELGHGLFTYCVLLGLQGEADGGAKDSKITVKELSSFLDDKVPELSKKHKGTPQYPSIYGYGMDFPIIIIKK